MESMFATGVSPAVGGSPSANFSSNNINTSCKLCETFPWPINGGACEPQTTSFEVWWVFASVNVSFAYCFLFNVVTIIKNFTIAFKRARQPFGHSSENNNNQMVHDTISSSLQFT